MVNKGQNETLNEEEKHGKENFNPINSDLMEEASELGKHLRVNETKNNNEESEKLKTRLLMLAADFENFKKRSSKDVEDARNYSITNFAKGLLSVMDNFDRSIEALKQEDETNPKIKAIIDGIIATKKDLENNFARQNINSIIPAIGDNFDHNMHQAITQIPTDKVEEGKICDLMQIGYLMKDRLLRPALVAIAVKNSSN